MKTLVTAFISLLVAMPTAPAAQPLTLTPLGTLKTGEFRSEDPRVAEINDYDPVGKRIYVVNPLGSRVDIIDASNPSAPAPASPAMVDMLQECQSVLGSACPLAAGNEPNSLAIHNGLLAVALGNPVRTNNGHAAFFKLRGTQAPRLLAVVEVGAVPDMITFTSDGTYALIANEGEPSADYTIDPPGSVSVIHVAAALKGKSNAVRHAGFERFDGAAERARLAQAGVRIFGPGASVSQDLEPEYIAVHGNTAFVTLQENNALAIVDIAGARVERVVALGLKDHSASGNWLDASDQDGVINIRDWKVHGMYQPDAMAVFIAEGQPYLVMANEGDAREWDPPGPAVGLVEALRLSNSAYVLDPTVFPDADALKAPSALGRLNVSRSTGDLDGDGDFDRVDVFGARSVSIRDRHGALVWDSGDMLEHLVRDLDGTLTLFNTTSTANSRENRSDDKGIEPESVVVGHVGGRPYAFVGLERDSGIVVLDLSNPAAPEMVSYTNNRRFPVGASGALLPCNDTNDCGDLGPEGLTFVPAAHSPTGKALLIVSNEASSTTTIWQVE